MKKLFVLIILSLGYYVHAMGQDSIPRKTTAVGRLIHSSPGYLAGRSSSYRKDIAKLNDGYNEYGNTYAIKDYLVKGNVSLVCVTFGTSSSSRVLISSSGVGNEKRYYLQKAGTDMYTEIHLSWGDGFTEDDKNILIESIADSPDEVAKVRTLNKLRVSDVKQVLKSYNSKHR